MKGIFFLFTTVVVSSSLYAQWKPIGATTGNINYLNGNVGIGIDPPNQKLHVYTNSAGD